MFSRQSEMNFQSAITVNLNDVDLSRVNINSDNSEINRNRIKPGARVRTYLGGNKNIEKKSVTNGQSNEVLQRRKEPHKENDSPQMNKRDPIRESKPVPIESEEAPKQPVGIPQNANPVYFRSTRKQALKNRAVDFRLSSRHRRNNNLRPLLREYSLTDISFMPDHPPLTNSNI